MDWIDQKYALLLADSLENFKVKKQNPLLINCRCKLCGDSEKNLHKARGYIIASDVGTYYMCHNCGASLSLQNFIKIVAPHYLQSYIADKYLNSSHSSEKKIVRKLDVSDDVTFKDLPTIENLPFSHKARKYVLERKIPKYWFDKIFYIDQFKTWINSIIPKKFASTKNDEDRIVIPLQNSSGKIFGVVGRSLKKDSTVKYITILFDENEQKLFGLNRVDTNDLIYVLEGPIDSMFVKNAIAVCGSNLNSINFSQNAIFVFDNQPRNLQISKKIEKTINQGYKVVLFPNNFPHKDINEAIMEGVSIKEMNSLLRNNIYEGLEANLKFLEWKRV